MDVGWGELGSGEKKSERGGGGGCYTYKKVDRGVWWQLVLLRG